jgi:hypothetical protein
MSFAVILLHREGRQPKDRTNGTADRGSADDAIGFRLFEDGKDFLHGRGQIGDDARREKREWRPAGR